MDPILKETHRNNQRIIDQLNKKDIEKKLEIIRPQ
jgi:hypothetical protein